MSSPKLDPLFPGHNEEISNRKLTEIVTHSLYKDFSKHTSTIKKIGQITGANLRTIKNWYDGLKVPSSLHFIKLVKASPTLQQWILTYLFGPDFWEDYALISQAVCERKEHGSTLQKSSMRTENYGSLNVPLKLNKRQKWFLLKLKMEHGISAKDITRQFNISPRTAKRDIADLKEKGRIRYCGARKNGYYEII
ncbi:MAG: HTH domain-containing protein [Pseudomonadota bacterium]